jgi:allophanate hydrolase
MTAATLSLGSRSLRDRYAAGLTNPAEVVDEVYARIAARGDDHVWISLVPHDRARAAAAALDPADLPRLPLYGLPFAVKDNIDVAGMATTAACPEFATVAAADAALVARLVAAGAVLVGKTNLDQFATGLNGTRSPYGVPGSVRDPRLIAGGSSSGSGVAVAAGLVTFAIGTDTAGSGRVPAALNGVVGMKPSAGLVSTTGVVPACASLDCASVFALDVADGAAVLAVLAGPDQVDPWSRRLPAPPPAPRAVATAGLRLGVPDVVDGWGSRGEREVWERLLADLGEAGVELVPVPMAPFFEAGDQLYRGVWLAERLEGLETFLRSHPTAVLPVIREVLAAGGAVRGVDTFAALTDMRRLRRVTHDLLAPVDALLTPTVTETFTVDEVLADPIALNTRLGRYTTFTNLLDLCAVAVPAGTGHQGAPVGVTVQHAAGRDAHLASVAAAVERVVAGVAGVTVDPPTPAEGCLDIAVVGAHLSGMPLHADLLARGAALVQRTATAPTYRLFALRGTVPAKPGLRRVAVEGAAIEVEVYRMPLAEVGAFLATVAAPLGIGQVMLADGREVHGFVCEPFALDDADDITGAGGWRAHQAQLSRQELS